MMIPVPFLRPRLIGDRFEGHAIPLEILRDFAVLEEMIVEVAKCKFLEENPGRQRVLRGFTKGIELRMTGVEDGSAIPVIALFVASSMSLLPPENQEYFEKARDAIVSAIGAAELNRSTMEHLPEKTLSYFDRIGRSLRDGEAIEFSTPALAAPARLTKDTRRKLVLASNTVDEFTEYTLVRGLIPEVDQDDMTFEIQTIGGHKIKAPLLEQHIETVLAAFNRYKTGDRVLIQGVGKFSRQDKLLGFETIEHISLLDPLDVSARVDELRSMKDGWLEGSGLAPKPIELDWFANTFEQYFPNELPLPYVYPTAEGGIQLEWSIITNEITLEIDLEKHSGYWHFFDMKTSVEKTNIINLNNQMDWEWIASEMRTLTGGVA